ncbi:MAG: hypothetical protein AB1640_10545 [bacterium]
MQDQELRSAILDASRQVGQAFESLSGFVLQSADYLRAGEIGQGNELLGRILGEFSEMTSFLVGVERSNILSGAEGRRWQEELETECSQMSELLKTALEAQQNNDWIYLADMLEYEIAQKLRSWKGMMEGVYGASQGEAAP